MITENIIQKMTVEYTTPGADEAARKHKTVADAQRDGALATATLSSAYSSLDSRIEKLISRVDAEANAFARSQAALKAYAVAQNAAVEGTRIASQVAFGSLQSTAATVAQVTRLAAPAAGVLANAFAPALGVVGVEAAKTAGAVTRELLPALGQTLSALSPILAPLAALAGGYLAAAAGVAYLAKTAHEAISAFSDFEAGQAKLQASLNVTGGVAGTSTTNIERVVRSIGDLSSTREAAAALVRLRQVMPDDVFEKTLRVAKDLSVLGFGSVAEAAKALANIVKEPIKAFDAFEKASISVGGAQREMIKDLVDSGKTTEALAKALDLVGTQAKGSADIVRGTLKGAYAELADQIRISNEQTGEQIVKYGRLTDIINLLAAAVKLLNNAEVGLSTVLAAAAPQVHATILAYEALQKMGVLPTPTPTTRVPLDQQAGITDLNKQLETANQQYEKLRRTIADLQKETLNLTPSDIAGKDKEEIKTLVEQLKIRQELVDKQREAGVFDETADEAAKKAAALLQERLAAIAGDPEKARALIASLQTLAKTLNDTKPDAETTDRWESVTKAIERQTARLQADTIAVGQGAAAQERLRVEFQLLEAAKEADLGVTDEQIKKYTELRAAGKSAAEALAGTSLSQEKRDELVRLADAAGAAKEALTKLQIAAQIKFESQTLGLSPEDVHIAQQLRSLYPDVTTALMSADAAPMRFAAALIAQARDKQKSPRPPATEQSKDERVQHPLAAAA